MPKSFPPNPSLENLKKQAKQLLKAVKAGDPEAIGRIRSTHYRFSDSSPEDISQIEVSLRETQHVIAQEYGFPTWQRLSSLVRLFEKGQGNSQRIAFFLSHLDPDLSSSVLYRLPEEMQGDVVVHMASGKFDESLSQEMKTIHPDEILNDVEGPKVAAEILNRIGSSIERPILDHMDAQDSQLAEKVRYQMYTFEDIIKQTDLEIQVMLRHIDPTDLALALKDASEELKDRIFANISERVGTKIKELMESSDPSPQHAILPDVKDVHWRIAQLVRWLEEKGEVTIVRGEED